MSTTGNRPGPSRPGGRTARTRAAVLDALVDELIETGYAGLTVESVARRAGVHATTVYRRWGNVEGLIIDELDRFSSHEIPVPDTGSFLGDLTGLARGVVALYTDNPQAHPLLETLVAAATSDPHAAKALREFFAIRSQRAAIIVERAVKRGELRADTDGVEVIAALAAPIYYRLLVSRRPLDSMLADRAATAAHAAAVSGAFSTPLPDSPSA